MHDTVIPHDNPNPKLRGRAQQMVFPMDLAPDDPDYEYRGQPKGMRRVLEERGLMPMLIVANGGKPPVGGCQFCKASRETQERLTREAQAAAAGGEEPEGTTEDVVQPGMSMTCCMRKALASQQDFKDEKPLLQIVIEEAGHKCYFLLKFHCELNPIEMYWGWTKIREFPFQRSSYLLSESSRALNVKRWNIPDCKASGSRNFGCLPDHHYSSIFQEDLEVYGCISVGLCLA